LQSSTASQENYHGEVPEHGHCFAAARDQKEESREEVNLQ